MSSEAEVMIRVEHLSKRYEIYEKPRDRLLQMVMRGRRQYFREFWALRDVSFEIRRGETVGIIGRNGSGKSTLLQLICGTLNPTAGNVEVNGRVAALLELGAGFNPEFTGRENVFMAAKLLGLIEAQIEERYDRIAAFADIGAFIDQPVKTYSSGMYVRLAFAVNAHVDADILVIDEALAVGDTVFTQKCMRYIRQFQEGGTLLFVSHDASAVKNLCSTALWLHQGQVQAQGASVQVLDQYMRYTLQESYGDVQQLAPLQGVPPPVPSQSVDTQQTKAGPAAPSRSPYSAQFVVIDNSKTTRGFHSGRASVKSARLESPEGERKETFEGGERVRLVIEAITPEPLTHPIIGFYVTDRLGQELFGENTLLFTGPAGLPVQADQVFSGEFVFVLPMLPNGQYALTVAVAHGTLENHVQHHWVHDILLFNVASSAVRWGLVGLPFEKVTLCTPTFSDEKSAT